MRNIHSAYRMTLCLVGLIAAAGIACSSGRGEKPPAGGLAEGWVNADTYRFVAVGKSKIGTEADAEPDRKRTACDAALLFAQMKSIEILADAGLKDVTGTVVVTEHRDRVIKAIKGFVRGGTVVSDRFDPVANECTVVYELTSKDLKKIVTEAAAKNAPVTY